MDRSQRIGAVALAPRSGVIGAPSARQSVAVVVYTVFAIPWEGFVDEITTVAS